MNIEICCLTCGGQYRKSEKSHKIEGVCPEGCTPSGHVDFCKMCSDVMRKSFDAQFVIEPKRKLRFEGETEGLD